MHRLLEIDPSSVMAHSNLSLFHNHLGDIEAAEHHLALATRVSFGGEVAADPVESCKAGTRGSARRISIAARRCFARSSKSIPTTLWPISGMGELAVERGRFSRGRRSPREGHRERSHALGGDPRARHCLEGLDDPDRARDHYERGIEIAAKKGDLATAQKMQERLTALAARTP